MKKLKELALIGIASIGLAGMVQQEKMTDRYPFAVLENKTDKEIRYISYARPEYVIFYYDIYPNFPEGDRFGLDVGVAYKTCPNEIGQIVPKRFPFGVIDRKEGRLFIDKNTDGYIDYVTDSLEARSIDQDMPKCE